MDRNLTLIFNHFEKEHLGKDVFLVPYYMGREKKYNVTIVYPQTKTNSNFPQYINGVHLVPLKANNNLPLPSIKFYMYLIMHSKSIDLLMRFHFSIHTELMTIIYKSINRKGKVYVKLDIDPSIISEQKIKKRINLKHFLHRFIIKSFLKNVNKVSCETSLAYQKLTHTHLPQYQFGKKLFFMPNGFDETLLHSFNIKERTFSEKENLIITVGRIGSTPKNTKMFLDALEIVDLKEWKVLLIGPIDDSFKEVIESFYNKNPDKKKSINFIGPIYDKKELWEFYNKAKVFVFTSEWESYALVLNEAKRFRNYIVSTEVGAFMDLVDHGKYGHSIPQNDRKELASILKKIIKGELNIDVYNKYNMNCLSWKYIIRKSEL